ncbi:BTAD domain-containing putative transcriptional regulator [Actinoplanes sp. NBRC 101535]|uniref:AfsR/SARP family transcriptional regulator n=1 Tax=Actinoplanes sp. NBRC 101535 TaxID=3032196 RepID=UPI0024A03664|nr:BTAD domain-containing putative transcriptional regulator [Actinoplanes sp. NBRC 101535]GLY02281.1 hypothetical protein Acsp01_26600 [Actinoplanes sp. NBRC 101535]
MLGPIEAEVGGRPVDLGRRQQRAFLGILLAARGTAVSTDRLVEDLWRGRPPARPVVSLQTYVSNLRRVLEPRRPRRGPASVLVRRATGYAVRLPEEAVDAWRFEQSLTRARALPAEQARPELTGILRWWRGPVFGEARDEPWAAPEATRLDELHLLAREHAIRAALRIGEHTEALLEARQLVHDEPLRTEGCRLAALALWAAGREPDALDVLRRHRHLIGDELGLDPAPVLTTLEQAILSQRREVLRAGTGGHRTRPAQLPSRPAVFTGRQREQDELTALVRASAGTVPVAVITGMGGVGKTALAVHWAHEHRDDFPDGQLHLDLRGFDPAAEPVPAADALRSMLTALGTPAGALPSGIPDRAALLRSLLTGQRVLIVLDNARDAAQVRDLIPGGAGCAVLITSRVLLTDLVTTHHAYPVGLAPLAAVDAHDQLTRRIGGTRAAADPGATRAIVAACDGLPLALAVVAARIAANPSFPLAAIARELTGAGRLDAFAAAGVSRDPRTVLSWSYRHLPDATATLFRHLALHPGPDVTVAAAAGLSATAPDIVRRSLHQLVAAHLIREHRPGRFRFHDLLRAYATELADRHDARAVRELVVRRAVDHYRESALVASAVLVPRGGPLPPPIAVAEALAWFDAECPNLLAALSVAVRQGDRVSCRQLARALAPYLRDRLHRIQ